MTKKYAKFKNNVFLINFLMFYHNFTDLLIDNFKHINCCIWFSNLKMFILNNLSFLRTA